MINCTRVRCFAAGLVLAVVAAGIGWAFYFREKQKSDALALRVAAMEPDAAEYRYLKETIRVHQAKESMRLIERAYMGFYLEHGEWPKQIEQVKRYLDPGVASVIDPWGKPYTVEIAEVPGADGERFLRPIVFTQPSGGGPRIQWPKK